MFLPGMGPILGAEFVVTAGDLTAYADMATWPRHPGWAPSHAIPAATPATCTGPSAAAAAYAGSSTCPRRPASSATAQPGLLPQETRRGLQTRPSRHRTRTTPHQRALGPAARQQGLRPHPTHHAGGLTRSLNLRRLPSRMMKGTSLYRQREPNDQDRISPDRPIRRPRSGEP